MTTFISTFTLPQTTLSMVTLIYKAHNSSQTHKQTNTCMHRHTHIHIHHTHMHACIHSHTHPHTHLVGNIMHSDKVASQGLLLTEQSMKVRSGVLPTSAACTVCIDWGEVGCTLLALQVHLTPGDQCRSKPLQA